MDFIKIRMLAMQPRMSTSTDIAMLPLADFGELQQRYQSMALPRRARAVLADAEPALRIADQVLAGLHSTPKIHGTLETIRKNTVLTSKMRPSEARNMLMDGNADFIDTARRKLQAWRKTMERLAGGEGVINEAGLEYVPGHAPVALALACISTTVQYLSIIQLALDNLAKSDARNAAKHLSNLAKIRRSATLISDCENASGISAQVH
jgi:hypothetical protein